MLNVIRVCGNEFIYNEVAKWKGDKILYNIKLMNRIINSFKNTKLHESNKLKTKSINKIETIHNYLQRIAAKT